MLTLALSGNAGKAGSVMDCTVLEKLKIELPYAPAISLPGIDPKGSRALIRNGLSPHVGCGAACRGAAVRTGARHAAPRALPHASGGTIPEACRLRPGARRTPPNLKVKESAWNASPHISSQGATCFKQSRKTRSPRSPSAAASGVHDGRDGGCRSCGGFSGDAEASPPSPRGAVMRSISASPQPKARPFSRRPWGAVGREPPHRRLAASAQAQAGDTPADCPQTRT